MAFKEPNPATERIKQLEKQVTELTARSHHDSEELAKKDTTIKRLEKQEKELKQRVNDDYDKIANQDNEIKRLNEYSWDQMDEAQRWKESVKPVCAQRDQVNTELTALKAKTADYDQLKENNAKLTQSHAQAQQEAQSLKEQLEAFNSNAGNVQATFDSLINDISQKDSVIKDMHDKTQLAEQMEWQVASLQRDVQIATADAEAARATVDTARVEFESMFAQLGQGLALEDYINHIRAHWHQFHELQRADSQGIVEQQSYVPVSVAKPHAQGHQRQISLEHVKEADMGGAANVAPAMVSREVQTTEPYMPAQPTQIVPPPQEMISQEVQTTEPYVAVQVMHSLPPPQKMETPKAEVLGYSKKIFTETIPVAPLAKKKVTAAPPAKKGANTQTLHEPRKIASEISAAANRPVSATGLNPTRIAPHRRKNRLNGDAEAFSTQQVARPDSATTTAASLSAASGVVRRAPAAAKAESSVLDKVPFGSNVILTNETSAPAPAAAKAEPSMTEKVPFGSTVSPGEKAPSAPAIVHSAIHSDTSMLGRIWNFAPPMWLVYLLFLLAGFLCITAGYTYIGNLIEREMWRAANDTTRAHVVLLGSNSHRSWGYPMYRTAEGYIGLEHALLG